MLLNLIYQVKLNKQYYLDKLLIIRKKEYHNKNKKMFIYK